MQTQDSYGLIQRSFVHLFEVLGQRADLTSTTPSVLPIWRYIMSRLVKALSHFENVHFGFDLDVKPNMVSNGFC